jgi:DNA-binding transcriptional LysR family regulator
MTAELRHIEAFLAVARCGNFTRAAAELHLSQPALTVQIRQLESALGLRLFDRNNRRVALTPIGRELVAPFERVVLDMRAIVGSAHDFVAHRRGVVTVACLPSIAAGLLPRAIAALVRQHAGIVVRVRDAVAARVADLVKAGDADFGISGLGHGDRELVERPLLVDRLAAFVPAAHAIAARRSVTLRELVAAPLILTGRDSSVRAIVDRAVRRERLSVAVAHEATYMTTALGLAAAGLGVAVLPEAARTAAPAGLSMVPIRRPVLQRQLGLVMKAGRSLSPAAQQLVDILDSAPAAAGTESTHGRTRAESRSTRAASD